jgi:hypothetical protein
MSRNLHFAVGTAPVETARAGAALYMQQHGMHTPEPDYHSVVVAPHIIERVAQAYRALPDFDPNALPAFHAMRHEVKRQFDFLTAPRRHGGMGFHVTVHGEDPYDTQKGGVGHFFNDVAERRMKVLSAASTGGHAVFSDEENEMFRAVHDVFGHAGTGRGVDRHGEEAAYRKHSAMFSPLARRALATETRGQNHAMIAAGGVFPEQKIAVLPPAARRFGTVNPRDARTRAQALLQAHQFAKQQGIA